MAVKKKKRKSKGVILTCGYYSLTTALLELHRLGWDIVKMHRMENPRLKGKLLADVGYELHELNVKALKEETTFSGHLALGDQPLRERQLTDEDAQILATFGCGGKQFMDCESLIGLVASRLRGAMLNVNVIYDSIVRLHKKYKFKAFLLHTAEGPTYRAMVETARILGIPTFCCFNGTLSGTAPKFSAHMMYDSADVYYLHGEYDTNYIERRKLEVDSVMVGQPSFDPYYKRGKIPEHDFEPNTFMFSSTVVCGVYYLPVLDVEATINMVDFGLFRKVLPVNSDGMFLEGFALYQREHNPTAKLVVSLRPYYNMTAQDYGSYLTHFGIENFQVFEHEDKPGREIFKQTEYCISSESTMLIEGLLNNKPSLYLTGSDGGIGYMFDGTKEWTIPVATDNLEAISGGLVELTEKKEELREAMRRWAGVFNYKHDGRAGKRLAKDLDRRIG